jgi:hypothetical protein
MSKATHSQRHPCQLLLLVVTHVNAAGWSQGSDNVVPTAADGGEERTQLSHEFYSQILLFGVQCGELTACRFSSARWTGRLQHRNAARGMYSFRNTSCCDPTSCKLVAVSPLYLDLEKRETTSQQCAHESRQMDSSTKPLTNRRMASSGPPDLYTPAGCRGSVSLNLISLTGVSQARRHLAWLTNTCSEMSCGERTSLLPTAETLCTCHAYWQRGMPGMPPSRRWWQKQSASSARGVRCCSSVIDHLSAHSRLHVPRALAAAFGASSARAVAVASSRPLDLSR